MNLFKVLAEQFEEISAQDFYRSIFPKGSLQVKADMKPLKMQEGIYNGIAISIEKNTNKVKRFTITDDLETINELIQTDDFCLMSPIGYVGKARSSTNARLLYALAIDLDGVDSEKRWNFLMDQINYGHEMLSFIWGLPRPTYIVSSGTGVHLYYVFEEPIQLFKNVVNELEILRRRITWQAWTQGASSLHDSVQYESLFQGFRMVGSITKNEDRAKAYKVGDKVTIEYLNRYVPKDYQATRFNYTSTLSKENAKELYPEWYQRRVIHNQPKNSWRNKRALYDWWIEKLKGGAEQGHRYWCIMTLATYAVKCGISREELERDAIGLIPLMNKRGDAFTEDDVQKALEAYNDSYVTYPIDTIVTRTGIPIQKNKRNYREQSEHLKGARALQSIYNPNWREGNGRPKGRKNSVYPKAEIIKKWRAKHPNGKKIECHRDTSIDPKTIRKWWNEK